MCPLATQDTRPTDSTLAPFGPLHAARAVANTSCTSCKNPIDYRTTMVLQAVAARATANAARRVVSQQQKRSFAGHGKAKPEWTGIDKVVRGYFPEDHQRTSLTILECRRRMSYLLYLFGIRGFLGFFVHTMKCLRDR